MRHGMDQDPDPEEEAVAFGAGAGPGTGGQYPSRAIPERPVDWTWLDTKRPKAEFRRPWP